MLVDKFLLQLAILSHFLLAGEDQRNVRNQYILLPLRQLFCSFIGDWPISKDLSTLVLTLVAVSHNKPIGLNMKSSKLCISSIDTSPNSIREDVFTKLSIEINSE